MSVSSLEAGEPGKCLQVEGGFQDLAVCLKCGAMKSGVFIPCPNCQREPDNPDDKDMQAMASDYFLSRTALEVISWRVRNKLPVQFEDRETDGFFDINPPTQIKSKEPVVLDVLKVATAIGVAVLVCLIYR